MQDMLKVCVLAAGALLTLPLAASAQYEHQEYQGGMQERHGRPEYREREYDEGYRRHHRHGCHTEVTREWRHNHMVTKKVTVCHRPYH